MLCWQGKYSLYLNVRKLKMKLLVIGGLVGIKHVTQMSRSKVMMSRV